MTEKTKFWLLQIFATKIGWLGISLLCMVVFGILSNFYEWAETPTLISLIWPVVLTVIMTIFAFIINPIREYRKNKKNKK